MHQLSMNGSLLLLPNHDRIWRDSYWKGNDRPQRGWSTERLVLLGLPAWQVRRELWESSWRWWSAMSSYRRELGQFMLLRGLVDDPRMQRLDDELLRVSGQLEELAWCLEDDQTGQIEVVGR